MRALLIQTTPLQAGGDQGFDLRHLLPAWLASGVLHVLVLSFFLLFQVGLSHTVAGGDTTILVPDDADEDERAHNLTVDDLGDNPDVAAGYNVPRIGDVVNAQQTLAATINTYLSALDGQWQAVVDLAALLQLDDLFQLGQGECVAPVPVPVLEALPEPKTVQGKE